MLCNQRLAQVVCFSFVLNCRVNPQKLGSIQKKLEAFCAQDLEIKQWAQKVNKLCSHNIWSFIRAPDQVSMRVGTCDSRMLIAWYYQLGYGAKWIFINLGEKLEIRSLEFNRCHECYNFISSFDWFLYRVLYRTQDPCFYSQTKRFSMSTSCRWTRSLSKSFFLCGCGLRLIHWNLVTRCLLPSETPFRWQLSNTNGTLLKIRNEKINNNNKKFYCR